ncbi:Hypothetical_protein [Hexamita inflata]|uniref:Hypothetical_protein n=1 Tax=Hexamita inflata TaxID=28002 RepID=A0AA86QJ16_9EUKA|nr:Hypothetical protein HINF_LOCUS44817 [Hexamita inflata]
MGSRMPMFPLLRRDQPVIYAHSVKTQQGALSYQRITPKLGHLRKVKLVILQSKKTIDVSKMISKYQRVTYDISNWQPKTKNENTHIFYIIIQYQDNFVLRDKNYPALDTVCEQRLT